jgi:hypothetical protein
MPAEEAGASNHAQQLLAVLFLSSVIVQQFAGDLEMPAE